MTDHKKIDASTFKINLASNGSFDELKSRKNKKLIKAEVEVFEIKNEKRPFIKRNLIKAGIETEVLAYCTLALSYI
jgi:hypothetical protein